MAEQGEFLTGLDGQAELLAAARSGAYRLFAEAMIFPDGDALAWIQEGQLADALYEHLGRIDPALCEELSCWAALRDAGPDDTLAIEYTRLFDAGAKGPPCALYGGLYGGARMKVMEEAVRFYNHFGLTLSETPRELPDHLATQLEFVHYLAYREAECLRDGRDPGPYRRAQRDFLERHLGSWIPKLCERLRDEKALPFFARLVERLGALLAWDVERLHREVPRDGHARG